MSTAARIRADERSSSRAVTRQIERTLIPANLAPFERIGLSVETIDETSVRVAGKYVFFPATGFWRSNEGSLQGYGAKTLIADAWIGEQLRGPLTLLPEIEPPAADEPLMIEPDPDNQAPVAAGVPTSTKLTPASY